MSLKPSTATVAFLLILMTVGACKNDKPSFRGSKPPSNADLIMAQCNEIDSMISADFARHPVGSVTIGVVLRNKLFWTKSYGDADMEKKLPADQETVYRIGSITKMFTDLMLEQMVDAGTVHLSDPVEKYFPEIRTVRGRFADAPPITLFQLATHTSGLDREPIDDKYVVGAVSHWETTLIAALADTRYAVEPGTRFSYSNVGFAALGAALSRAAGERYVDYLPKHIFNPLGMSHTALEPTAAMMSHLSKGYIAEQGKADSQDAEYELAHGRGYKVPNGAIYTTVGDLANFSTFLMAQGPDSVLKAASLERNLTQSAVQADFQLTEGSVLGGMVIRRDHYIAFGHAGAVAGYQAALYLNRGSTIGVIVLANALGSDALDTKEIDLKALDKLSSSAQTSALRNPQ